MMVFANGVHLGVDCGMREPHLACVRQGNA